MGVGSVNIFLVVLNTPPLWFETHRQKSPISNDVVLKQTQLTSSQIKPCDGWSMVHIMALANSDAWLVLNYGENMKFMRHNQIDCDTDDGERYLKIKYIISFRPNGCFFFYDSQ